MPIKIPKKLPAFKTLQEENIFVMPYHRAERQDIRPLEVLILNLMPKKIETETQILRLLSNTPLQVHIELLHVKSHVSKNTPLSHLSAFYTTFDEIRNKKYDALIITGAPIELLPFEEVDYWAELCDIMEWSKSNVFSTMYICWGAQAGLYYHYGIPKHPIGKKMFGIFPHKIEEPSSQLLKGFDDGFLVPHSRYAEISRDDVDKCPDLEVLTSSDISGIHIVAGKNSRQYFITGHSEYDRDTLAKEYFRDLNKGLDIEIPYNYFPDDDISKTPNFTWRCHANLMFSNWLNYCVYQRTPFNLDEINEDL